ncbi:MULTISPECIES: DUF411 domain-containing protein [Rhodobacterales]|jgi:hypothetical protein|uniref:DUF411 domain-containing protein n=5 Tax=Roseobacteraceae TaxID=2854170 RepID=A0A9Q2S1T3_9RHOB|nr:MULTISPECIES: DUF411 domain-containing protein [Rhodobacterales]OUS21300.1 metal-binding protein [Rhodobacterales bacterium 59_46_T64]EAQ43796.1 putative exported protein [Roseobacter sp. MED193]MBM2323743.1 DUF411 domain-containing protein [Marivita cryptomonadis]MBM2333331.1 DUF411 domain-containing protein [Marivita cryptomonadis]MBM2342909.1 DUF411 domain-containing protein [Marivita cryptomonadis]
MMKRRTFLLAGAAATLPLRALANTEPVIKVLKTPTCGCCTAWVDHVRQAGFTVEAQDVDQDALYAFKDRLQIAPELAGCHTAIISDYFIEGHVPAADITRLLAEQPVARGLTVPGMPMSSPGMGGPGAGDTFDTLLVGSDGVTSVFASHS